MARFSRIAALAAVATAVGTAVGCGAGGSPASQPATAGRDVALPWQLLAVQHGRLLVLRYSADGCMHGPARALVQESRRRVRIEVRGSERIPASTLGSAPRQACSAVGRVHTLSVHLHAPLAGRAIVGRQRLPNPGKAKARRLPK